MAGQQAQGLEDQMANEKPAHVIVLGNEKGGSGKSTLAMHIIVSLLETGQSVAALDLDTRQRSLSRFIENRNFSARYKNPALKTPAHITLESSNHDQISECEEFEFTIFAGAVSRLEYEYDFLVIDTPGHDSYLSRLGHAMADTLITPVNDSFIDLDVIAKISPETSQITGHSQYTEMVMQAKRRRMQADGGKIDWIVTRNRLSSLDARNKRAMESAMASAKSICGFRIAAGLGERVIYRELFTRGLTMFDVFDKNSGINTSISHIAARQEVRSLIGKLNLPDRAGKPDAQTKLRNLAFAEN